MTAFTPVLEEARRPEHRGFYAPAFALRIEGENLPQDVLPDVMEVRYTDSLTEIDRFEITVGNWDAAERKFRFIGSEPDDYLSSADDATRPWRLFQPCGKVVELRLGYADRMLTMMLGNFTTLEPAFPADGAPTLQVVGLNVLHQLRRKRHTTAWSSRTPSWIARNIATLKDGGQPRFPLPVATDAEAEAQEPELEYVAQTSQHDVDFLLNLGRQHGYEVVVQEANEEAGTPRRLWFGPGDRARPPVNFRLDWGSSLIEFRPSLTSANQVKSVTVNGWDRQAQRPIRETVAFDDPALRRLNADLREFVQCDPREELVVDRPAFTRQQARDMARAILRDRAASVVTAQGRTVGLPELRAGTKVLIGGLGARLSGEYLVTRSEHSLDDAGYTTRFECRREQLA